MNALRSFLCVSLLLSSAPCLFACQPAPAVRPSGIKLRVQFQTPEGRSVNGGWVESAQGQVKAAEGKLELALPFDQQGQHIVVKCPLLYKGALERHFLANTLSAGGDMEMTMICEPLQRVTGLSVHSHCKDAEILLDDRALGQLKDGWLHAWLTENDPASTALARERPLHLIARARSGCRLIDPLTQRPTSQLEVTLALSPSSQAVWLDLPGQVQAPIVRRAPKKAPSRPYRL